MYMKVHEHTRGKIVAACDKALIGKVLHEGDTVLDLKGYASFYRGEPAEEADLLKAMRDASSVNLVGEKAVSIALEQGILGQNDVKYINGVPHIQIYRI